MLLLFVHTYQNFVGFMLILLTISRLQVAFLSVLFLSIKLLFQLDITNIRVTLDNVIPKDLLLVKSMLDLTNSQIRCIKHTLKSTLESIADQRLVLIVSHLGTLQLLSLLSQKAE